MNRRIDRRPKRRAEAIKRMEGYSYDDSRAKRLNTVSFEEWYLTLRHEIERLTA